MSPFAEDGHLPEIARLIHDLRQPLSTIETCAYLLRMLLEDAGDPRVVENLERIELQVAEAERILLAATRKGPQRAGREDAAGSLRLTNVQSAALT